MIEDDQEQLPRKTNVKRARARNIAAAASGAAAGGIAQREQIEQFIRDEVDEPANEDVADETGSLDVIDDLDATYRPDAIRSIEGATPEVPELEFQTHGSTATPNPDGEEIAAFDIEPPEVDTGISSDIFEFPDEPITDHTFHPLDFEDEDEDPDLETAL